MESIVIDAQRARGRFDLHLFARIAHVDVAYEQAGKQQATEDENNEAAADNRENPDNSIVALRRRWLRRDWFADGRTGWCG